MTTLAPPLVALLASSPTLHPDTAVASVDGDAVVWAQGKVPIAVDRFVGAVLPHLDGTVALDELVADLAVVVDTPTDRVASHVSREFRRLAMAGAVAAIDPVALEPPGDQPDRPTVEELPDGRRLMSVTLEFSTNDAAGREVVADLLSGDRTRLDVIPSDSCVGQKLRTDEDADRFGIEVGGSWIAVRSGDSRTSAVLRQSLQEIDPTVGATVAVVTSPFAGAGPPRVYDAYVERVGLPRDGRSAADIVGHLLNEFRLAEDTEAPTVKALAAVSGDNCVLLPSGLLKDRRFLRLAARTGINIVPTRQVVVHPDGVLIEAPFGRTAAHYTLAGLMVPDFADALSPRTRAVLQLAPSFAVHSVVARRLVLERLAQMVCAPSFPIARFADDDDVLERDLKRRLKQPDRDGRNV